MCRFDCVSCTFEGDTGEAEHAREARLDLRADTHTRARASVYLLPGLSAKGLPFLPKVNPGLESAPWPGRPWTWCSAKRDCTNKKGGVGGQCQRVHNVNGSSGSGRSRQVHIRSPEGYPHGRRLSHRFARPRRSTTASTRATFRAAPPCRRDRPPRGRESFQTGWAAAEED